MKTRIFGIVVMFFLLLTNSAVAQKIESKALKNSEEAKKERIVNSRTERLVLRWQKLLTLTEDQVATLEPIVGTYVSNLQDLKANENLSNDEKKSQAAELRKGLEAEMRTHLTDEQIVRIDKYKAQREKRK